ncbi:aminotransferase-like domain-containing protein [Runella slithyformis]|uniref:Transcriptional regulator, GntR family with aminotransferase domain n=1 Tax=Runella slithyformis (strain ATCC 29530 / DSM 19594 / LMG 11500 / NCIMB 11436 / LSU 4) TaxID=761193 RepID=A0A7U3ZGE5_RUNSL|nr:aminotransferase class I/II-fold pyridoxal phosphate-dependent enzyme [Runella slithyformis]AEI46730.1 transcriptional regulator, GntR family with aminotransferase domain [Runella slithyformis DSM 19594]
MTAYQSLLVIDKTAKLPAYLQLANQMMNLIRGGELRAGQKLLGTRQLAQLLGLHRKTVVQAYDELLAQGWLESRTGSGTYVVENLPEMTPQPFGDVSKNVLNPAKTAGFSFNETPHLQRPVMVSGRPYHLDDGFPDPRMAPLNELSGAYRSNLLHGNSYVRLGYGDTKGSSWLRRELAVYLNETRGLKITEENVLITRGTVMGLYLVATGLLNKGDNVAVGALSWLGANMNFRQAGAHLHSLTVDDHGPVVEELEQLCQKKTIRLVYLTSHHHYPTTVALRADRRLKLLQLAETYGFIVFEDDYDYDFHYLSKPLLPLAAVDRAGMVLYCGSFTKTISPAFRVGYLVGPENVISHLAQLRRIIDRQGDTMLENSLAELLQNGVIQRHLRKSLRAYRERRDVFCELLKTELGNYLDFQVPNGGMAVWARFDKSIDMEKLSEKALKKDLFFSNGLQHNDSDNVLNATRLGFASSTPEELEQSVGILKKVI